MSTPSAIIYSFLESDFLTNTKDIYGRHSKSYIYTISPEHDDRYYISDDEIIFKNNLKNYQKYPYINGYEKIIYYEDSQAKYPKKCRVAKTKIIDQKFIHALLIEDYDAIINYLHSHPFLASISFFLQKIHIEGMKFDNIKNYAKVSRSGNTIIDPIRAAIIPSHKSYVQKQTYINRYDLAEFDSPHKNYDDNLTKIYATPYENYDDNLTNVNCVLKYVMKRYKRISKKIINYYFNHDYVQIEKIKEFTTKYKIHCRLYNIIANVIYDNKLEHNTNHSPFVAIVCNGHLYPYIADGTKNFKPKFFDNLIKMREVELYDNNRDYSYRDSSIYIDFNRCREQSVLGRICTHLKQVDIDKHFFHGLIPNMSYKAERYLKMKALFWTSPAIKKAKFLWEIDMNKAYFNITYNIIEPDQRFPIFTAECIWKKYKNEPINDISYYFIKKSKLKQLNNLGVQSNFMFGFLIKYLDIQSEDIEYYKNPYYKLPWIEVIKRIDKLAEDKEIDLSFDDEFKKNFIFYNGVMGKLDNDHNIEINNVMRKDDELLNHDSKLNKWKFIKEFKKTNELTTNEEEEEYVESPYDIGTFQKTSHSFRYLNQVNIFNFITQHCSFYLLQLYSDIKTDANLLKINTDALVFDAPVIIPDKYKKWFKVNTNIINYHIKYFHPNMNFIKPKCNFSSTSSLYHDGQEIINNILTELNCFKDNVSIHGTAGSGKTTLVKGSKKLGIPKMHYDYACSITNVCALNISDNIKRAHTIYSLLQLHHPENIYENLKKFKFKTIWIDEYSMVNNYIWNFIFILATYFHTKFIISGDYNQLEPVKEKPIDITNQFFSHLMGKQTELFDEQRNDKKIIELKQKVLKTNDDELRQYFKKLNLDDEFWKYDRHLTHSRRARNYINQRILKKRNLKFTFDKKENKYIVSDDVLLCARLTLKRLGLYKNDVWKVTQENILLNLRTKEIKKFENINFRYFKLGFAMTCHSAQGLTIIDDLCIHEVENMIRYNKRILYTALTRAREFSKLHFYYNNIPYGNWTENLIKLKEIDEEYDIYGELEIFSEI
jgi:hypothetical protein